MAPNPVNVIDTFSSFSRFITTSPRPTYLASKNLCINPIQSSNFRVSSSSSSPRLNTVSAISSNGAGFKDMGHSKIKVRDVSSDLLRVSAVSDGGTGGGFGDSGDGNTGGSGGGGDGAENGGSNWSFISWYLKLLEIYPLLTKSVTSALLNLIGDLACQILIDKVPTVDLKRTFIFTLLGFSLVGPALHFWYLYLSKLVTSPGATGAVLSLVLDQFIFSPIFLGVFLSTLVTLEGKPSQVVPKLQQEWFSAVIANWQLWIPFQFLNFRFVPQNFQVLAANVVALAWNVILSFKAHKAILPKQE
ncbi:hypothetical protein MKX01_011218 [Papaver californicum]|nr:hypothetical protein MKX01_011218 [Papaver californicum]